MMPCQMLTCLLFNGDTECTIPLNLKVKLTLDLRDAINICKINLVVHLLHLNLYK